MARSRHHTRRSPRVNPRGVLVMRAGGFGFVQTAEGEFFIPASKANGAFDGDVVELAPLVSRGKKGKGSGNNGASTAGEKPAARVLRVVERAHDTLVGRYEVAEPFGVVVPEDTRIPYDIFTMRADYPHVPDGALVRVRIATFPSRNTAATGVIEEVIGMADDEDIGVDLIVARHKLETAFSEAALAEAAKLTLDEEGALAAGYRDVRDRTVFTIDPADARDFDDALSLEAIAGQGAIRWRLGVHIADVSQYVPWNSSIDFEARRRATSVYLVDRVIPMLPEALCNELCSLKPGVPRRAMTVDLYLDEHAKLVRSDIYPALIVSKQRFSYDEVDAILNGEHHALEEPLHALSQLAKLREKERMARGGIDFATTEAKVRLNDEGRPVGIDARKKTDATSLVEEAMIFANETVARFLEERKFPNVYRVHEQPAADALAALVPVFQEFAWWSKVDANRFVAGNPHAIQDALALSQGRPEAELVSMLVLRAMKRAVYKAENGGHYGLASAAYSHFTSPIRRYPDLVTHRMLRAALTKRPEYFDQEVAALPWICEHSSDMERVADTAARESQELKMVEYLAASVGQSFSAVISGVATYGLYVRLENTAEGFVPVRALGQEYFSFDPVRRVLYGQDTGVQYRLGQRIAVVLAVAEPRAGKLEFKLATGKKKEGRR